MGNVRIEKKKDAMTLYFKCRKDQTLDAKQKDLIESGEIQGLIPFEVNDKSKITELVYNVTGCVPLKDFLKTPLDGNQFTSLIRQCANANVNLGGKLPPKGLILDLPFVLVNRATGEVLFVYAPVSNFFSGISIEKFLGGIVKAAKFTPGEETDLSSKITKIIDKNGNFVLEKLQDILLAEDEIPQSAPKTTPQKQQPAPPKPAPAVKPTHPVGNGTVLLTNTTLLTPAEKAAEPRLIRQANGQTVSVDLPAFRIGRDPAQTEFAITDNNRISRLHATITTVNSKYFITDNGSANKTYVDGMELFKDQPEEILSNANIRLADEDFTFEC